VTGQRDGRLERKGGERRLDVGDIRVDVGRSGFDEAVDAVLGRQELD